MDRRLREDVQIGRGQLGFMKIVGSTLVLFTIRQMMENSEKSSRDFIRPY